MKTLLLSSAILIFILGFILIPSASALPVSYNTTSINLGLTSVPRNSSSYDVFPLIPDNWLWEKFDNNTIDSSPLSVTGTITYNTNAKAVYHFENVLTDSSTSARTLTKTAGTTTYVGGHEGQGLSFDGSTYYTASDTGLPTGNSAFSVSTWVNYGSFVGAPVIFDYGTHTGTHEMTILTTAAGKIEVYDGTAYVFNTALSLNTWYHIVITFDGTTLKAYENGVLDSNTFTPTFTTALSTATMGAYFDASQKLTGTIDEFRFYNTNLSQAQVSALYMVGHYSQSHTFDGGEFVTTSTQPNFKSTDPFTISFWFKDPSSSGSSIIVLSKDDSVAVNSGYGFWLWSGDPTHIRFNISNGGSIYSEAISSTNVVDGNWHYISGTYDGSGNGNGIKLYVDGTLQSSGNSLALSTITNSFSFNFGGNSGLGGFVGQLDNAKIYPYALSSSQITSDFNSISPISSGKQFMSWYHGVSGSATLTNKLGFGQTTTLLCNLSSTPPSAPMIVSNMSNIYYQCGGGPFTVKKFDIVGNTNTHVYTSSSPNAVATSTLFMGIKHIFEGSVSGSGFNSQLNSEKGNVTQGGTSGSFTASNQEIANTASFIIKFNDNSTAVRALSNANLCNISFNPTNVTKALDSIACDQAVPAMAIKYWNGMMIQKIGGYSTNTTQQFLSSIDASAYKKLLTLPCALYGAEAPCITFILTDQTQTDYLVVLTSAHVYYGKAQTALGKLNNNNYGFQSYDIITQGTSSSYEIQNPILQSLKLYGPINLNVTVSKAGLFTLPSGYSVKTTSIESAIRTIDPRWTNDATDIPIITSTGSLFPIFLTVSNAPVFSAIKVTNPYQLINSQESVWAIAQLDSTRTVEFDLPSNVCVNVYVADISVSPSIWNFQGIICASGVNQKTISYTNTLPFTFWTYPWGASDSFTPNTNGLVTTVRHTTAPFSYNVILKNSTGVIFQNTTYTSNSTIDTQNFNLTGKAKPVSLYINSVTGGVNQIYSAFLGSPISLASTASFFNQYFSYQGFNLLAFIPIIFASMFTRNTIGIGVVLTVLCIATLSWLSVVVIPELDIMIMIVIAIIGLIAYRLTYY